MVIKLLFFSFLIFSQESWAITRDNTANIGDSLDANDVPAESELRVHEYPNKPDHLDKNKVPAKIEERQREEEIKPFTEKEEYEIYRPKEKENL